MRALKWSLSNSSLLTLLTLLLTILENVESYMLFGPDNDPAVVLQIPDIHHNTALQLCRAMNETQIPHAHRYLWAYINPEKKQLNSLEKPDASMSDDHLTVKPACVVYKWRFCEGKTRYPLVDKCGFFEIIPQSDQKCEGVDSDAINTARNSISTEKHEDTANLKQGETEKEVNPDPPILMSHGQAIDLCLQVNGMPTNKRESTPVKFTPIRLEIDARARNHLSKDCVFWKFTPCTNGENNVLDTNECGKWSPHIIKNKHCQMYQIFIDRNLKIPGYGNYSQVVEDFFQSPPGDNEHKEERAELSIDAMELNSVSDLVHCQRLGGSVSCTVLRRPSVRIKREEHDSLIIKRFKRSCCSVFSGCWGCLGYHENYSWLRNEAHSYRRIVCDCGMANGKCWFGYNSVQCQNCDPQVRICTGAEFPGNICTDCHRLQHKSL